MHLTIQPTAFYDSMMILWSRKSWRKMTSN